MDGEGETVVASQPDDVQQQEPTDQQQQPDASLVANAVTTAASDPTTGLLGENGLPLTGEAKKEIIPEEVLKDMGKIWDVFDM